MSSFTYFCKGFIDRLQKRGFLVLFFVLMLIQWCWFFQNLQPPTPVSIDWPEGKVYLKPIDNSHQRQTIYPFNPNFISDYKGYQLGMSVEEIDRLHRFRENGKFVNSAKEFQNITRVSDSLLKEISPYFKFPDWVNQRNSRSFENKKKTDVVKKNINLASAEELKAVYGIGEVLSARIVEHRDKLGSIVDIDQLQMIYGLREEVIPKIKERFYVVPVAPLKKININQASIKELSNFPFFNYGLAKKIVAYRTMKGTLQGSEDLSDIDGLNAFNLKIIALYLEF